MPIRDVKLIGQCYFRKQSVLGMEVLNSVVLWPEAPEGKVTVLPFGL